MTKDQLFTLNGLKAKAIAAQFRDQAVTVQPAALLEVVEASAKMRQAIAASIVDCEACRSLGDLVTDRCPRCRPMAALLGET